MSGCAGWLMRQIASRIRVRGWLHEAARAGADSIPNERVRGLADWLASRAGQQAGGNRAGRGRDNPERTGQRLAAGADSIPNERVRGLAGTAARVEADSIPNERVRGLATGQQIANERVSRLATSAGRGR